jgi:hypothetical protein
LGEVDCGNEERTSSRKPEVVTVDIITTPHHHHAPSSPRVITRHQHIIVITHTTMHSYCFLSPFLRLCEWKIACHARHHSLDLEVVRPTPPPTLLPPPSPPKPPLPSARVVAVVVVVELGDPASTSKLLLPWVRRRGGEPCLLLLRSTPFWSLLCFLRRFFSAVLASFELCESKMSTQPLTREQIKTNKGKKKKINRNEVIY